MKPHTIITIPTRRPTTCAATSQTSSFPNSYYIDGVSNIKRKDYRKIEYANEQVLIDEYILMYNS